MIYPNSKLESTKAGTTNVQAVIDSNWQVIDALLNPALSSADAQYMALLKGIIRTATLPTKRARLEWLPGTPSKPVFRDKHGTIVYAGTITFDMDGPASQSVTLTGDLVVALTTLAEGQEITIYLDPGASLRNLTWPASIRWLGAAAPATIAANKLLAVTLRSRGTTAANVVATFTVEP